MVISFRVCIRDDGMLSHLKTKIGKNLQKFSKNSLQMEKGVL
jgi:hypothetical protein